MANNEKTTIYYRVVVGPNPNNKDEIIKRPIITRRETYSLNRVVKAAIDSGRIRGKFHDLTGVINGFMDEIKVLLEEGAFQSKTIRATFPAGSANRSPKLTKLMKDGLVGEVKRLYGTYEIAGKNIPEMEDIADARLAVYDAEGQFLAKTKLTALDAPQKNTFTRESSTRVIYKLGTNNSIEPDGTWEDPTSQCKFEIELKSGVVLDIPFRFAEE